MDNLQNITEAAEMIGGADGPTAVFLAGKLGKLSMGIMIISVVIGLLFCFLGHKLIKVISALLGLSIGIGGGFVISGIAKVEGMPKIIIIFGCAVVLAALLFFLYRVGIFLMTFTVTVGAALYILGTGEKTYVLAALGAAAVLGIAAMIFAGPSAVIITALSGGMSAGTGIASLAGLTENPYIALGFACGLTVTGMIVQFILYAKKTGKKEKAGGKKRKKKDSMESEVEKARMLLDDDGEDMDD